MEGIGVKVQARGVRVGGEGREVLGMKRIRNTQAYRLFEQAYEGDLTVFLKEKSNMSCRF